MTRTWWSPTPDQNNAVGAAWEAQWNVKQARADVRRLAAELDDARRAEHAAVQARDEAVRVALDKGVTAYRLSLEIGLSQGQIGTIRRR